MKNIIRAGVLVATLTVSGLASAEGLRQVRQVIFGMDCAPCAYGVEEGLKELPGVESVTVSLNDGYAEVALASGSGTSMSDIREVIRNNGFTPKEAHVQLEGRLELSPQSRLVTVEAAYALQLDRAGSVDELQGRTVSLRGSIAGDSTAVHVVHLEPAPRR